eukprot:6481267-Amphidinium_carterae.1
MGVGCTCGCAPDGMILIKKLRKPWLVECHHQPKQQRTTLTGASKCFFGPDIGVKNTLYIQVKERRSAILTPLIRRQQSAQHSSCRPNTQATAALNLRGPVVLGVCFGFLLQTQVPTRANCGDADGLQLQNIQLHGLTVPIRPFAADCQTFILNSKHDRIEYHCTALSIDSLFCCFLHNRVHQPR